MFTLHLIFSDRDLLADVSIHGFESRKSLEKFQEHRFRLSLVNTPFDDKCIHGFLHRDNTGQYVTRKNIQLSLDASWGNTRPLNPYHAGDKKIIMETLEDPDSPYHAREDDFQDVDGPIETIWRWEVPCCLGSPIAYRIEDEGDRKKISTR